MVGGHSEPEYRRLCATLVPAVGRLRYTLRYEYDLNQGSGPLDCKEALVPGVSLSHPIAFCHEAWRLNGSVRVSVSTSTLGSNSVRRVTTK